MLRICQSEIFAEIGPHRPKNSRFSSSDSFRVILIADEIETRYDFITSCMVVLVVPNCCPQLFSVFVVKEVAAVNGNKWPKLRILY